MTRDYDPFSDPGLPGLALALGVTPRAEHQDPDAPAWDCRTCANGKTLKICRGCNNANSCAKRGACLRHAKGKKISPRDQLKPPGKPRVP